MPTTQEHYWKEFYRLKVHTNYTELLLGRTEFIDRGLKMFLAIASSASIGGWVLWQEHAMVWAIVIAGSQVVNAISQYLPYKERLRSFAGLLSDLEDLVIHVEDQWLRVAAGEVTEEEIRKSLLELRTRKSKSFKKHLPGTTAPEEGKLFAKAEQKTINYFQNFYE